MKCCVASLIICSIEVSPVAHQNLHNGCVPLVGSNVQWSQAISCADVNVAGSLYIR